jgi:hypothetical protein
VDHKERYDTENRRQRNHKMGLRHSILHAHISRKHWSGEISEEKSVQSEPHHKKIMHIPATRTAGKYLASKHPSSFTKHGHKHSRELLDFIDTDFVNRMNSVQKYATDVALGDGVVQILPKSAAEKFVEGPILWPSVFIYNQENTCNVATLVFKAVGTSINFMKTAYDEEKRPKRPPVSFNPFTIFIEGWQRGQATGENLTAAGNMSNSSVYTETPTEQPWYIRIPVNFVKYMTGLTEMPMIGLALELPEVISRMFRCDVADIMFCSGHHYSVFTSAVIALTILTVIGNVFSFSNIPIVATLLSLVAFTSLILFISFNYAPGCAPLIPMCFFESLVDDVVKFLPKSVIVPQSLISCQWDQTQDGTPPASCIVSCEDHPYQFHDWTSNFAWMLCEYYPQSCKQSQLYISTEGNLFSVIMGAGTTQMLQSALYRSRLISKSHDTNMRDAYSWCNTLTSYKLVPLLMLAIGAVTAFPLLIGVVLRSFVGILRTAFSAYAMTHS